MYTQVYNAMKSRHLPSTQKLSPRSHYKDEQIYKYIERLYIINHQRQAYRCAEKHIINIALLSVYRLRVCVCV